MAGLYSSQENMFPESQEEQATTSTSARNIHMNVPSTSTGSVEIRGILKELKGLVQQVNEMNKSMTEIKSSIKKLNNAALDLDTSSMKKPYLAYLKGRFYTYPWIVEEDEDLKEKCRAFLEEAGCEVEGVKTSPIGVTS
ncbi:uncharacterized protein [Mytilus edulis]|uniref:uncharacterized protein n=1 Tax=Mytilus edulis TaxID=6550 RepID=UPI0039EEB435